MTIHAWLKTGAARQLGFILVPILAMGLPSAERAAHAAGATYYVSPSGSDGNVGTSTERPWQTIDRVNAWLFGAGDSVLFEGGQSFPGTLTFEAESGMPSSPIMVGSYGAGRATISAGLGAGIFVHNSAGFHITNIDIVGSGGATNTSHGIYFLNDLPGDNKLEYIQIDNVDVSRFGHYGILLDAAAGMSGYSNVRIEFVIAHENADGGIGMSAAKARAHQNVYIGHSQAYDNRGIPGLGRNSGNGIVLGRVDNGVIERSVAHDNGGLDTADEGPVGIWAWDSTNVVIQYNESYDNHTGGAHDGGGFDLDLSTSNSVMQYNYSHGNDGAGFLLANSNTTSASSGNIVRYNISQNDGRKNYRFGGLHVYGAVYETEFYQNTVYMSPVAAAEPAVVSLYEWSGTKLHFRNNILLTTSGVRLINNEFASGSGLLFQGNDYWTDGSPFRINWNGTNYASLGGWRAGAGQERDGGRVVGLEVDPRLANAGGGGTIGNPDRLAGLAAYRLRDDSPLIDSGLDLPSLYQVAPGDHDYYGYPIPAGRSYDVGAHEAHSYRVYLTIVIGYRNDPTDAPATRFGI
jgi:hypothetical protein